MPGKKVGLDNPVFAGRLRSGRGSTYERRAAAPVRSRTISDVQLTKPAESDNRAKPTVLLSSKPTVKAKRSIASARTPLAPPPRQRRSMVLKRQSLRSRPSIKGRRPKPVKTTLLTGMAVVLFILGVGIGISSLRTNNHVAAQVQRIADTNESSSAGEDPEVPSEAASDGDLANYRVAPTLPRIVTIPKIGVEARVLRLGVKANNELKAPSNIFDAGWYEGSAKPGEAGAVLLDGHVSGPTRQGVFYKAKTLQAGDRITIERGDGTVFNYRVHSLKTSDADSVDMAAALTSVVAGRPGLNLITCAGAVDASGTGFTQRTVVFAVQE
jgi:sortase (surface protein transpeptidase)